MSETYLGDGAYLRTIPQGFELYTSNGIEETNRVVLEPATLSALLNALGVIPAERGFDIHKAVDIAVQHRFNKDVCACGWRLPAKIGDVAFYAKLNTTPGREGTYHIMSEVAAGL